MRKIALVALQVMVIAIAVAQTNVNRCATFDLMNEWEYHHPGYKQRVKECFDNAKQLVQANRTNRSNTDTIYRIQCVFHVVYTTAIENIPDSVIYNQIDILNRDYRRRNADTIKTRDEFKPFAADAGIEFYLATTDPQGNATTGITRTQGTPGIPILGFNINDEVKSVATGGVDPWPTDRYLNIWVCKLFAGVVLGYAYPPSNAPNWDSTQFVDSVKQGVVLHYAGVGSNFSAPIDPTVAGGRSAVHEIGHYLGLRHIWGDGDCTEDDGISDTPDADAAQQQTCDTSANTCVESPHDYHDMIENYMDYSDDRCQNMFTAEQVGIMRAMLQTTRSGIGTVVTTAIRPVEQMLEDVQLFPNPANSNINLRVQVKPGNAYGYEIYNTMGQRIISETDISAYNGYRTISLNGQAPGMYLIKISSGGQVAVKKFQLIK